MSDTGDPQDIAEALDADKIDDADGYGDRSVGDELPDRPSGVLEYGVTDREQAVDEPLAERVRREEPEVGQEGVDERLGGDGPYPDESGHPGGLRLADDAARAATREGSLFGTAVPDDDLSAEEAAVHVHPEV